VIKIPDIVYFRNPEGKYLPLTGGTMQGNIDMNLNEITNLAGIRANDTTDDIYFSDYLGNQRIAVYDLNSASAFVLGPALTGVGYVGSSAHKWYRAFFSDYIDMGALYIGGTEVIDSSRNAKNLASLTMAGDINMGGYRFTNIGSSGVSRLDFGSWSGVALELAIKNENESIRITDYGATSTILAEISKANGLDLFKDLDMNSNNINNSGDITLDNDKALKGKKTDDTIKNLIKLSSGNNIDLGASDIPLIFWSSGETHVVDSIEYKDSSNTLRAKWYALNDSLNFQLIPSTTNTGFLGSSSNYWRGVYANYLTVYDEFKQTQGVQIFHVYPGSTGKWYKLCRINTVEGSTTGGEAGYIDIEIHDGRDIGSLNSSGTRLIASTRNGSCHARWMHYGSLPYNSADRSYLAIYNDGNDNYWLYLYATAYGYCMITVWMNRYGYITPVEETPTGTCVYATNSSGGYMELWGVYENLKHYYDTSLNISSLANASYGVVLSTSVTRNVTSRYIINWHVCLSTGGVTMEEIQFQVAQFDSVNMQIGILQYLAQQQLDVQELGLKPSMCNSITTVVEPYIYIQAL